MVRAVWIVFRWEVGLGGGGKRSEGFVGKLSKSLIDSGTEGT